MTARKLRLFTSQLVEEIYVESSHNPRLIQISI